MPQLGSLHFSDSLFKLIEEHKGKSKCCKLLHQVLSRLGENNAPKGDCPCPECRRARKKVTLLNPKLIGNYFSFREKPGMISYCPKGKTQAINDEGQWSRKGRVEIKPDKWVKSMLHPKLVAKMKDHEFTFGTIVKAEEEAQKITFKFVSFRDAYNDRNYSSETRPESCMWNREIGPFYELLGAKALIAMNGKGIYVGRAIFWPNVKRENGEVIQLLDRIYTRSPEMTSLFKAHAQEKGWHYKYKQNRSNLKDVVSPDEDVHSWVLTVEADEEFDKEMYFPFLDTFQGGRDNQSITNVKNSDSDFVKFDYASTNGVRETNEDHRGQTQLQDGSWAPIELVVYVDGYGAYLKADPRVKECAHTGNWYMKKFCSYVEHKDFWVNNDYLYHYPDPKAAPKEKKSLGPKAMKPEGAFDDIWKTATIRTSGSYTWQPISIGQMTVPAPPEFAAMIDPVQGEEDTIQF